MAEEGEMEMEKVGKYIMNLISCTPKSVGVRSLGLLNIDDKIM